MKKTIFIYSGEGTKNSESSFKLLKHSKYWAEIEAILHRRLNLDLETMWKSEADQHRCPYSPLLTVVAEICLTDIWRQWGYQPDAVIGHSTGELTAAFEAGFYSLEEILVLTHDIGALTAQLRGVMAHGVLTDRQIDSLDVNLSSFNFTLDGKKHVSLSGYADEMEAFLGSNPDFTRMKPLHPWHHPDYRQFVDQIPVVPSRQIDDFKFVSGVTTAFETRLGDDHWQRWVLHPIDFIRAMQTLKDRFDGQQLEIIEIGFHPVLAKCCEIFDDYRFVSSMFRGEDEIKWILFQRKLLDQSAFLEKLSAEIQAFTLGLDLGKPLAYQGLTSINFVQLAGLLEPYFPSLAPQDFYRYKSINQLIDQFGIDQRAGQTVGPRFQKNEVVVAGMSCRFPSAVETPAQFWTTLLSRQDQVRAVGQRGDHEAGYLDAAVSRFDHQYFDIGETEAQTMDPQQILALELVEMLWRDAGIDPRTLDRKRVGVYIGVWNQEYAGRKESVYYPTGTNPSIIASRISYHYDLRGPSWVSNTACSSSLVAVHYASKDIEDGRIDFAIAGGVNMLLGNDFTHRMHNSGFLSKEQRCKAFDNSANGYVRAEGGGLVLLANKEQVATYYAVLAGSSVNQNGGRSQTLTAPHPEAQEELILDACDDAGIAPQQIAYVECHGTGTKIGDPIEISAIQNTVARGRKDKCHLGSVKSNLGHLESAAGIAGLIKSLLIVNHGVIPPNLHFHQPNQFIDFEGSNLHVVAEETPIDKEVHIGVSSFGFGGTNAHVIIKGVVDSLRKAVEDQIVPFNRGRARPLQNYFVLDEKVSALQPEEQPTAPQAGQDVRGVIGRIFFELTGIEQIDTTLELHEQGLDSLSATHLIHYLEREFNIQLDADILFEYPLLDQFAEAVERRIAEGADDQPPTLLLAAVG
jgi:acyl transferase domain-containing protein/acyl carrier protein